MGTTRSQALFLDLEPGGSQPISRRIAGAIIKAIREGRLPAGRNLPGTRALATGLGVHRNTIIAAFHLLEEEGWVETRAGSGTFVRGEHPKAPPERSTPPDHRAAPFDLPGTADTLSEVLDARVNLRDLVPDGRLFATQDWVRSYHHALQGSHRTGLSDKDPRGLLALRKELRKLLAERRGVVCDEQQLVLISSPMRGLDLAARLLIRPGDPVAVEEPGLPELWAVLRNAGARLLPIPVDAEGMDVGKLVALAEQDPPRLVVVSPGVQHPTGVALSQARRDALLDWSVQARIPVLEDDTWGLLDFSVPPLPALAAQDRTGGVLQVGSLGTALAPGMEVGYFLAHPDVIEHAIRRWRRMNLAVDPFVTLALTEWFQEGLFHRQLRKVRDIYQKRLSTARDWIGENLGEGVLAEPPSGGLGLWLLPGRMSPDLHTAAAARGILLHRPLRYWLGPPAAAGLFLAYGAQESSVLIAALERLRDLLVQDAK
jgi:GntR family transcriptional regulator/MocR family aminotransferase